LACPLKLKLDLLNLDLLPGLRGAARHRALAMGARNEVAAIKALRARKI